MNRETYLDDEDGLTLDAFFEFLETLPDKNRSIKWKLIKASRVPSSMRRARSARVISCASMPSTDISHGAGPMTENGRSRPVSRVRTIICTALKRATMPGMAGEMP